MKPALTNISALLLVSMAASAYAAEGAAALSAEQLAFFETKVRPVLVEQCYSCHSAEAKEKGKLKAGLLLDSRQGLLTGGESGPALVAGKPRESLLIKVMRHEIKGAEMPPKGKLPDAVIADFTKWIEIGAPDPRVGAAILEKPVAAINVEKGREWWAFKPLTPPIVPVVKKAPKPATPIDAFILARLAAAGIVPNPAASKEKLLRRATFDLTGLPPTPEERAAFLNDASADAYEKLVDRLLESPRYGERWGRHWLDVVRYAESGGYEFDNFRPGAYHYRDWVIRALNDNMPFNEFIRMQLAGDQIKPGEYDGASATGFLVAGPYPGQTTVKTEEKIRYDQLDDMVSVIGSGFLGLTTGCVRCHDHKFDPLPQRDYYGIAAALATTVQAQNKVDLNNSETKRKLVEHEQTGVGLLAALKKFEAEELPGRFADWQRDQLPQLQSSAPWQTFDIQSAAAQHAALDFDRDGLVLYSANKTKDDVYTVKVVTRQRGVRAFRLDALSDATLPAKGPGLSDNGNFVLADVKIIAKPLDAKSAAKPQTLTLKPGLVSFEQKDYEFAKALDDNQGSGWGVHPQMGKDHAGIFLVDGDAVGFEGGTEFEFQLRFSGHFGLGRLKLAFGNAAAAPALTDAQEMQNLREVRALIEAKAAPAEMSRWFGRFDESARKLTAELTEHQRKRPQPLLTEVYTTGNGGRDVFFLRRGEVDRKEDKARPGFIQVLMRSGDAEKKWLPVPEPKQPALHPRVALGNWMTDAQAGGGALLARVIANRLWRQHFGRGIVATGNDFGVQGEKPTHPELLEFLASELVKNGWRLKPIHRLIMLSNVYQQSGEANPAATKRDPENLLWAQRPARRQESEAIRDALLQVGGKIDFKMFGPSESNQDSGRRSVYLRVKRSELVPFMTMFDAPEPTQSIGERGTTTVPSQALALMNSPFVRSLADQLLVRVMATKPDGSEAAIRVAYEIALCRLPDAAETQRMKSFIEQQTRLLGDKPGATDQAMREFCRALLCLNEFVYVD